MHSFIKDLEVLQSNESLLVGKYIDCLDPALVVEISTLAPVKMPQLWLRLNILDEKLNLFAEKTCSFENIHIINLHKGLS